MELVDGKEALKAEMQRAVTSMFHRILKDVELTVDNSWRFKRLRSRILDVGNDTIRTLQGRVDMYEVKKDMDRILERFEVEEEE